MQKEKQLESCYKNNLSSREVVARDLPHPTMLSLLNRKQQPYFMREAEDPAPAGRHKPCGMTPNFMGFTLIELLVVVLIIGILAAVAVPQYQKAVYKTLYTNAIQLGESIAQAEERYYLANNTYTCDMTELDIDLPADFSIYNNQNSTTSSTWRNAAASLQVRCGDSNAAYGWTISIDLLKYGGNTATHYSRVLDRSAGFGGKRKMLYTWNTRRAGWEEVFKSLGGQPYSLQESGWYVYYLPN